MTPNLDYAKYYLSIGWSLLPIVPETKTPAIKWAEFQDRCPTLEEVEGWLKQGWHLAVVTGPISGILIVDDDRVKHGLNEWGFTSSIVAKTKSGGKHYYFTYDREIHSHSNATIRVDIKAWHSYCLLPPFNGREWVTKPSKDNLLKLTSIPDDIVRLINSDTKDINGNREPLVMSDFIAIPVGGRTDALHKIACSVFSKYSKEEGLAILLGINATYTPPLTKSEFDYQVGRAWTFIESSRRREKLSVQKDNKGRDLSEVAEERVGQRQLERIAPRTGLPGLDNLIKGFVPGRLYTLTGQTNVGKTALAINFSYNVLKQGKRVLYFSLEPGSTFAEYFASIQHNKTFAEITDEDIAKLESPGLTIYDSTQVTSAEAMIKIVEESERYDLIVVDHIGYFIRDSVNVNQQQTNVLMSLATLAKAKQSAIVLIAHLRKDAKDIPTLNDISGSAGFKQNSTDVLIVTRENDANDPTGITYLDSGLILVPKSKSGISGVIKIYFGKRKAGIFESSPNPTVEQLDYETTKEIFA